MSRSRTLPSGQDELASKHLGIDALRPGQEAGFSTLLASRNTLVDAQAVLFYSHIDLQLRRFLASNGKVEAADGKQVLPQWLRRWRGDRGGASRAQVPRHQ